MRAASGVGVDAIHGRRTALRAVKTQAVRVRRGSPRHLAAADFCLPSLKMSAVRSPLSRTARSPARAGRRCGEPKNSGAPWRSRQHGIGLATPLPAMSGAEPCTGS